MCGVQKMPAFGVIELAWAEQVYLSVWFREFSTGEFLNSGRFSLWLLNTVGILWYVNSAQVVVQIRNSLRVELILLGCGFWSYLLMKNLPFSDFINFLTLWCNIKLHFMRLRFLWALCSVRVDASIYFFFCYCGYRPVIICSRWFRFRHPPKVLKEGGEIRESR